MEIDSKEVSRCALEMALSRDRESEKTLQEHFASQGIRTAAINVGGNYLNAMNKFIEQAIVAAKRENLISAVHHEEGAIAGAMREALSQIQGKAIGLNIGGKIGLARAEDHVTVALFVSIGMLYLNETAVAVVHRTI